MDLGLVNIATLRISLSRGATAAFVMGLGSTIGDLIYFSLAVLGATALLGSRSVRLGLWVFGTVTLLFMSYRAVRDLLHPKMLDDKHATMPDGKGGMAKLFVTGVGLALASPSAILWFAAVGGSVIASYGVGTGDNRRILTVFAAGFASGGLVWAAAFAFGAVWLRRVLGWRLAKGLSLASAVLFLYFAVDVFVRGLREF
jgi:L-lysine exporter family protein LysE/ArgO